MGFLKTLILSIVTIAGLSHPAEASDALHDVFAGCVGRFSAEMEHAWLMGDGTADVYETQRGTFLSLMEATMPAQNGPEVLAHRLDHKMAHASLLTLATFGQDARRAKAARLAARRYLLRCEELLLRG